MKKTAHFVPNLPKPKKKEYWLYCPTCGRIVGNIRVENCHMGVRYVKLE